MISNFFNKSKPIHLVIVSIMLLVVFCVSKFIVIETDFDALVLIKQTLFFLTCLASVLVLDFLVSKNSLTKKNSFKILLYVLFIALLPETILNSKIILANFFVLLALRRIISLRSHRDIKKKLFDAAFWISIATLLYFWAVLFYILVIFALVLYSITGIKNWVVPFVGVATVLIICVAYMLVSELDPLHFLNTLIAFDFDFSPLNFKRVIVASALLFSYAFWSLFYFIKHLKHKSKSYRPSFILVIANFFIALSIIALAPNKTGSEFLFFFTPLAIIVTNYLEVVTERWFKESLLIILFLTPIGLLLL